MANILLTQKCIRSCPYCFARKHMHDAPPEDILKWEDLIYIVDFFQAGGDNSISLLGGEPFLHPEIVDYILYIISRGMHVTVFTSGVVSEKIFAQAVDRLADVDPGMLSFVVNLNNPKDTPFSENETIGRFMATFARFTCLSINVYKLKFDYSFAVAAINKYGLQRHIRLGLAHPIPGKKNMCIKPDQMSLMATELIDYLPTLEAFNIRVGFDCGVPMCAFTDDQLGKLFRHTGGMMSFRCGSAIDIGPDMEVWSCFPMSGYNKKSLFEFKNRQELCEYFDSFIDTVRTETGGMYQKCDYCDNRLRHLCSGGCLSHALNNFVNEAHIRNENVYPSK
ncbi:MAG: radical SAM protein [Muribaculaceae bacterium]|nr:radical SAM protein [Muribaculaceae bacterium]